MNHLEKLFCFLELEPAKAGFFYRSKFFGEICIGSSDCNDLIPFRSRFDPTNAYGSCCLSLKRRDKQVVIFQTLRQMKHLD